jgi:hypothetical protein
MWIENKYLRHQNNFKSKTYEIKNIDQVIHYNFGINYVHTQGCLEI